ncbi:class I adenylate-forming enzyme family protein [Nisaea denitrificans]|uniref:class I adenylate-forming enzyme family protein n=1 Tax=Nisaea denitrificans TaxID=390877 RepID=UPI00040B37A5|nr:AMP-binding protein [Nisaea denitrificans]
MTESFERSFSKGSYLHAIIDRRAEDAADRILLSDAEIALDGRGLKEAVDKAADALKLYGVRGGDRVVLVNENAAALLALIFALSRIGAWTVLVNARLTGNEIRKITEHAGARTTLFTTGVSPDAAAHAAVAGAVPFDMAPLTGVQIAPLNDAVVAEPLGRDGADQVAALIYTSGTTGQPKGVMLTHDNLLFIAEVSGSLRAIGPKDLAYGVLPTSHVFGLASVFLGTLAHGGHLHTVSRFAPKDAARALAEDGVTIFQGVPAMYAHLLELAAKNGAPVPAPMLRYLSAGGAPLDLTVKAKVEAMWKQPLHNGYGLTETSPTVTTTRMDDPAKDETVGPAIPGVEFRIADRDTGLPKQTGDVGEIWIRGPNVMKGYYRDTEQTAQVITSDGWFRSGDLGRVDAAGNLYVVGRLKELIIRSGFNVYPAEVEGVLAQHSDIALSAVVGRVSEDNEEVVAFIQPIAGRTIKKDALEAHMRANLAPYKCPSHYVFLKALPATATGKILKAELKKQADIISSG